MSYEKFNHFVDHCDWFVNVGIEAFQASSGVDLDALFTI